MSFPKSKRFESVKCSNPAPGSYDPKVPDHTPGLSLQTSERFKASKDDQSLSIKYGSESALDAINGVVTPKKMLFKLPASSSGAKAKKDLKKKEEPVNTKVRDLEKELRSLVNERADVDKRLMGRESEVSRLEGRLQQVHKDNSVLTARVATLERNISSVTKSNETLKNKMSLAINTQSKSKGLQQELTSLQTEADKQTREAKCLHEQLEKARKEAEVTMEKSKAEVTKLQEEHKVLEKQQKSAQEEIEKLKKEIEKLKGEKRAVEEERDAIQAELEAAQRSHKEQQGAVQQDLDARIAELTEKEAVLNANIETLATKNENLEQNLVAKHSVEEERDAVRAELEAVHIKHEEQLRTVKCEMEGSIATLSDKEVTLQKEIEALVTKTDQLEEKLGEKHSVEEERDAFRAELELARIAHEEQLGTMQCNMESRIATLTEREMTLNTNLETLSSKTQTLEQNIAERRVVEEERDAIRSELEAAQLMHEEQLGTVQYNMESRLAALTEQEATLNTNIEALTTKYHHLEENLECIQKEHQTKEEQLNRQVDVLRTSLSELQSANDTLQSINTELMGRFTHQQDEVDLLEKKLSEAECISNKKFELLTNYLDSKAAEIDQLKERLAEKSSEVARLTSELESAQETASIAGEAMQRVEALSKELEQRSLEEQDLRWQLEKAHTQVVENQELVETRDEELRTMRHLQKESERETNEEMEVIRTHMERLQAEHRKEVQEYSRQLEHMTTVAAVEQDQLRKCSETAEVEMLRQITKLEEDMTAAEKASLDEIEGLKMQLDEKEASNQRELKRMQTDMAGCENAAASEMVELKNQLEEAEQSANQSIQSLVNRLAEIRLQNNEVIAELKDQMKEGKEERYILEESHRRALEAEKSDKRHRVAEQKALKTNMEKLRQELDAERAANACSVRLLEEERDRSQEALEDRDAFIADLQNQLEDAENLLSENVTTLEEQLRKSTSQMEQLHLQIEDAEHVAKQSEEAAAVKVNEIRKEMANVEIVAADQVRKFEDQLHAVQEEAHKEVSEVTNLLEDVRAHYDAQVSSLSARLQVRDEEIARLNAHLNETQQVANSVKEKCVVLKAELTRLTEEHSTEREQITQQNEALLAHMEQENMAAMGCMRDNHWEDMTRLRHEHEAELERRSTENGAHHHLDLQQMIKAHQQLQEKYDALEQLVGPFQEQLSAFEADRLALIGSKSNAEQEVNKLSDEYAKLLGHHNQKQKVKHVQKLKQENNSLKHDLTIAHDELTKLRRQYTRLEDKTRQPGEGGKKKFDPTKAFHHAKSRTPPVSPLRPANRI